MARDTLFRSNALANDMSRAAMPYIHQQGAAIANIGTGVMQGAQFVQNLQRSQFEMEQARAAMEQAQIRTQMYGVELSLRSQAAQVQMQELQLDRARFEHSQFMSNTQMDRSMLELGPVQVNGQWMDWVPSDGQRHGSYQAVDESSPGVQRAMSRRDLMEGQIKAETQYSTARAGLMEAQTKAVLAEPELRMIEALARGKGTGDINPTQLDATVGPLIERKAKIQEVLERPYKGDIGKDQLQALKDELIAIDKKLQPLQDALYQRTMMQLTGGMFGYSDSPEGEVASDETTEQEPAQSLKAKVKHQVIHTEDLPYQAEGFQFALPSGSFTESQKAILMREFGPDWDEVIAPLVQEKIQRDRGNGKTITEAMAIAEIAREIGRNRSLAEAYRIRSEKLRNQ